MNEEKKGRFVIIGLISVIVIIILGVFIHKNNLKASNDLNDKDIVNLSNIYEKDTESKELLIITNIELDKVLKNNETLNFTLNAYDINNNKINTYKGHSSHIDFKNNKSIQLGLYLKTDTSTLEKINNIKITCDIKAKANVTSYPYEHLDYTDYKYDYELSMHRISLDLKNYYKQNGGIAKINYDNGESNIRFISSVDYINFVGIATFTDITKKNASAIRDIDVYQKVDLK